MKMLNSRNLLTTGAHECSGIDEHFSKEDRTEATKDHSSLAPIDLHLFDPAVDDQG